MAAGYLLLHPFSMLASMLDPSHRQVSQDLSPWRRQFGQSFSPDMLIMGLAFSFMGGLAGLGLGAWHLQKLEARRRQAALDTLQQLMVTLAHHIRNANMVVGGFNRRLLKNTTDPESQRQLKLIQQASQEIAAVIDSLQSLTEIDHSRYIGSWDTKMIDLRRELAARLQAAEPGEERHDP
jgi:signal transduction histidine kinase